MSNVISLHGNDIIAVPLESDITFSIPDVLKGALDAELDSCIVIGDKGEDLYLSSSLGNLPKVIYLLELAKHRLLSGEYGEEDDA